MTNSLLRLVALIGLLIGLVSGPSPAREPEEIALSNAEIMARILPEESAPDVVLGEGSDLLAFTLDQLGPLPANAVVAPLIIPAAGFNADSQSSPYFFSFGSGLYSYLSNTSCHMAPAYLPHGSGASTVTVDNFFIFALDNNGAVDTTYQLWRKSTTDTSTPALMGTVATMGASPLIQVLGDTTIDNAVVTSGFVYYVTWCFNGPSQGVQGFWIYYTETAF